MNEENKVIKTEQKVLKDYTAWLQATGLTKKADNITVQLFLKYCIELQLNPIKREVYLVPMGNSFTPVIGFQVFLQKAYESGLMEYHNNKFVREQNIFTGQEDIKCITTIKRKDSSKEHVTEVWFSEWRQNSPIWKSKPQLMFDKCALANAFRKVFPERFGSFPYTADELWMKSENEAQQKEIEEIQALPSNVENLVKEYKELNDK